MIGNLPSLAESHVHHTRKCVYGTTQTCGMNTVAVHNFTVAGTCHNYFERDGILRAFLLTSGHLSMIVFHINIPKEWKG